MIATEIAPHSSDTLPARHKADVKVFPKPERLHHLDSLRGLAALVVVFTHWRNIITANPAPLYLVPFTKGANAVTLFFVLSGYVLSLPYWNGRQHSYGKYLYRRFCRIYLPYAGALLFAVLVGSRFLDSSLPLSIWFYHTWHTAFTWKLVVPQFAFAWKDGDAAQAINPAFWSLRPEMFMSIVFPAICWLLKRLRSAGGWAFAVAVWLVGQSRLVAHIPYGLQNLVLYASAFIFGAMLARERDRVRELYRRIPVSARYLLAVLIFIGFYHGGGQTGPGVLAASGVLVFADCSRVRGWLTTRWPLHLGRISYSLYLLHIVFLFTLLILLYGKVPLWLIFVTYLAASLVAAHFYHKYVEEGSIALGRRW